MRRFLLPLLLIASTFVWATPPTITIDGDKSDWAEVPMISEPGIWPMLKVIPAADANLGTNALAFMMENTADFDPTWAQYPTEFIDKDYDKSTEAISEYWAFPAMGVDYKATTGVNNGGWISFPKAMSADNKVFEIGFPATYITDLGSKFGFAMYYNSGAWFCPDYSSPAVKSSESNGFLYKNRSFSTMPCTLTMTNVFAHQSIGECTSYVDFGLRDNGNDTARWAAWPVELTKPGVYDITTNVSSTLDWKFEFWLVDVATNVVVAHKDAPASNISSSKTSHNFGILDLTSVPAGKYMLKVKNRTQYSTVKLESVKLDYIGGAVQNMPGTTDIDEAWFSAGATRASGKISFPEGKQDEGWVKWNVAFASSANFNVNLNVYSNNGKKFTVALLDADGNNAVTPLYKNGGDKDATDPVTLEMGAMTVPAGNYTLMVTNAEAWSDAEVISVQFVPAGGGLVDIPGDISFSEVILSSRAFIDGNGEIRFTTDAEHSHVTEESVKWRVNVSKEGNYKFTTSVNSTNGHSYLVSVYNADETVLKGSVAQSGDDIWGIAKTFSTDNIYLAEGEYRLIIQNTTPNSNGRIVSISASYEGGAVVNIPTATVPLNDAILNGGATRDGEGLHFKNDQYVEWNIHATTQGLYTFAATCTSSNYSNLTIKVKQGASELFTYTPAYTYTGGKTISSPRWLLDEGDYTLQLINPTEGSGYVSALSATAEADVFVLDENTEDDGSIEAAAATGEEYTFLLKRSFEAGRYYTLCIPIDTWNSELKIAFGDDYELWEMKSATQSGDEIDLNFEQINLSSFDFEPGTPYIIKPSVAVQKPIFYNKKKIYNATWNNLQEFTVADFIGTFYKSEIPAGENNLYLQNNDLYYSQSNDTPIKGTRAWIRIKPAGGSAGVRARVVLGGQSATAIDLVNGELVNGTVKTIENGQLIIIRDGVRYNVMGIRLQ